MDPSYPLWRAVLGILNSLCQLTSTTLPALNPALRQAHHFFLAKPCVLGVHKLTHLMHISGWTMQEFANASTLVVLTQPRETAHQPDHAGGARDLERRQPGSDGVGTLEARREDEEKLADSIRSTVKVNTADRRPVWLYPDTTSVTVSMTEDEVARIHTCYAQLAGNLHTQDPVDLVRALYPLLWDRPVESPAELLRLVRSVLARVSEVGDGRRVQLDLEALEAGSI